MARYRKSPEQQKADAKKIQQARLDAGLSQSMMADKTGISIRVIQGWELGVRTIPDYVIRWILRDIADIKKGKDLF